MKLMLLLIPAVVLHGCNGQGNSQQLLKGLLDGYEFTTLRPVRNASDVIHVEFMLLLTQVIEMNEKHQTIEIGTWIAQKWTDEFMRWDPEKHNGVKRLFVSKTKVWLPDITLYNSMDRNFESYRDTSVVVNYNGSMRLEAPVIIKSSCQMDVQLFPFDTQVCQLKFSSWVYNGFELQLHVLDEISSKDLYEDVGVWELVGVKTNQSESFYLGTPFPELTYILLLRRKPLFHIVQIIIPCMLLSLLNLTVFVLPPESGEKISLGMANLLSLVLFQQLISNAVPPTADKAPIIGYFFCPMIVLSCTSIACTVVVLNLFHRDNRQALPRWVQIIVLKHIAKFVRFKALEESPLISKRSRQGLTNSNQDLAVDLRESRAKKQQGVKAVFTQGCSKVRAEGDIYNPNGVGNSFNQSTRAVADATAESPHDKTGAGAPKWKDVAVVIDRAAFFLSFVVTLLSVAISVSLYVLRL